MNWFKRTAALLVSLLLLSTAAQGRGPGKAPPSSVRTASRIQAQGESSGRRKMPVLPVLQARTETRTASQSPKLPELIVISPEEPASKKAEVRTETAPKIPELTVISPEKPAPEKTAPEKTTPEKTAASSQSAALKEGDKPSPAESPTFPDAEDWQLLLVNPWNELPEDYEVELKTLPGGLKIDARAYDSLMAMLNACRDDGLSPKICSAYRTQSKQTYLYNNKIARLQKAGYSKKAAAQEAGRWVARPGTSEHQLGLAVDLVSSSYQGLTKRQEKTAEQKWLMEHCWEYGFILRYPNDKSEITGIGYEPWHYRYVGVDVAQDVRASGLCFEEYLLLREESPRLAAGPR